MQSPLFNELCNKGVEELNLFDQYYVLVYNGEVTTKYENYLDELNKEKFYNDFQKVLEESI